VIPYTFHKCFNDQSNLWVFDVESLVFDEEDFFSCHPNIDVDLSKMKSASRRKEYLTSRFLAFQLGIELGDCDDSGRRLTSHGFASISHHKKWVALYQGLQPNGIDVQSITPTLINVANKFTTSTEVLKTREVDRDIALCKLWSAKEAAFKHAPFRGIRFIEDLPLVKVHSEYLWEFELKGSSSYTIQIAFRRIGECWLSFTMID